MNNDVYIVDIATLLPPRYRPEEVLGRVYGQPGVAGDVLTLAKKASRNTGVKTFSSVLDFDAYPSKKLISGAHTPKNWCCSLIDAVSIMLPTDEIGFLSVSYNISSHVDVLPNLACQVASERKLKLDAPPQEMLYHGCASGILQIKAAVDFCRQSNKAALVIVLEQCTWAYSPIYQKDDDDFRSSLRAHLLFSDGAAAVLIVPDSMVGEFSTALKIIDVDTGFRLGDAITMRNGHFLVGDDIKGTMPGLVTSECITPLLTKHGIASADVQEWAIHQGGLPVLMKFKDEAILGLTDEQLTDSADSFAEFGNLSSASCLFTLRRQFERRASAASRGMVVAFGAGYYFGCFLYEKCDGHALQARKFPDMQCAWSEDPFEWTHPSESRLSRNQVSV
jgi:predicted naringenin-chalcone synthase